jgi:glycosyltransferase involved in cell wall biosynthesis
MSSLYEGLPMVGLEGAGHGLPIVAFQRARVDDIVCTDNKPFVVPNGQVNALAGAVGTLLKNRQRASAIGAENKRRIKSRFTRGHMAERYLSCYRTVTG